MKAYPFKRECQMEMLRLGQPYKVGKAYGVHRETTRVWWHEICDEQEESGGLGTWSQAAIERELAMSRERAKIMTKRQAVGNLTENAPGGPTYPCFEELPPEKPLEDLSPWEHAGGIVI